MEDNSLVLPFIGVSDEKRNFNFSTELALIVCLAELKRKKQTLLRTSERITSISKIRYPVWAVPLWDSCLLLDGLASLSSDFVLKELRNICFLVEELRRNSVVIEDFLHTIDEQAKNSGRFSSPTKISFKALIEDKELIGFFRENIALELNKKIEIDEKTFDLPVEIAKKTVQEKLENVERLIQASQANLKGLDYALQNLVEEEEFHNHMILNELEWLREKWVTERSTLELEVNKNVKNLTAKLEATTKEIFQINEKRTRILEKKREKRLRNLRKLNLRKDLVRDRDKTTRYKKGSKRKTRWAYELERIEREISIIETDIKANNEIINKIKREGEREINKAEKQTRNTIAKEEEKIKTLDKLYTAKVENKKEKMKKIGSKSATIKKNLETLKSEIKNEETQFRTCITFECKLKNPILIKIPFYLVKYAKGKKERYEVFSPMDPVENKGITGGLKRVLSLVSETKLTRSVRPKSKKLHTTFCSILKKKTKSEKEFQELIARVFRDYNLLELEGFEETLVKGLEEITNKNWISSEEAVVVSKRIRAD